MRLPCHYHPDFSLSGYLIINKVRQPKPRMIYGVYWSKSEAQQVPFTTTIVLEKVELKDQRIPERNMDAKQLNRPKIVDFLKKHGGVFGLPPQQYFDDRDLG